jgi:hypothetical protein
MFSELTEELLDLEARDVGARKMYLAQRRPLCSSTTSCCGWDRV